MKTLAIVFFVSLLGFYAYAWATVETEQDWYCVDIGGSQYCIEF